MMSSAPSMELADISLATTQPSAAVGSSEPSAADHSRQADSGSTPPPTTGPITDGAEERADGYLELLSKLRRAWPEQPDVAVSWTDLEYAVMVPNADTALPTLPNALLSKVKKPFEGDRNSTRLVALAKTSGVIKPGTMTLILAPPGHGKTTMLKALSGRLSHDKALSGEIRYNGLTAAENAARGLFVNRLCAFVAQTDLLFPTLTVHETLDFAAKNSIPDPALLRNPSHSPEIAALVEDVCQLEANRAELLIGLLGMNECRDTIVGNNLLRGISGGQRKRVTLGEMLLTNARVYCLDEVTTGLDAAVALHIFTALRKACQINNSAIVTALLQPTPETYEQFDDVILMRDGRTVYHGPREDVGKWLWEVCGLEVPHGVDEAGFVVDFLTDPESQYEKAARTLAERVDHLMSVVEGDSSVSDGPQCERHLEADEDAFHCSSAPLVRPDSEPAHVVFHLDEHKEEKEPSAASTASPNTNTAEKATPPIKPRRPKQLRTATSSVVDVYHSRAAASPVTDGAELEERYLASPWAGMMKTEMALASKKYAPISIDGWCAYSLAQFAHQYPHSTGVHMKMNLSRQLKLMKRNRTMVPPRIFQAILTSFVVGTLFIQRPLSHYSDRMGLLFESCCFGALANLTEVPVASEARNVIAKQIDAGFFPSLSYAISVNVMHLPLVLLETLIFGSLAYWVPGFTAEPGRFFFFLFVFFINNNAISVLFRAISYLTPNPDKAKQLDLPLMICLQVFAGFLIIRSKIPHWLIEFYYLSPLAWSLHAVAINEFESSRYDALMTNSNGNLQRTGDVYLTLLGLDYRHIWKWMAVVYIVCWYLFWTTLNSRIISGLKPITPVGTRRKPNERLQIPTSPVPECELAVDVPAVSGGRDDMAPPSASSFGPSKKSFQLSALPFEPVTLTWRHINYSVEVGEGKQKHWRQLLNDISGYVAPGEMTALMGSSGAGKTTLMDVLADRKTMGRIDGEILVNGFPKDAESFKKLIGYVEENDIHIGTATVREALMFSAKMRLPVSVTAAAREQFVDEVMVIVGLTNFANRVIGDVAIPGLSPGQLKLVTIGVELVANPSVLFLDEPTSGLDAPSAARVMKAVRRIAATGRTVFCGIHQPSEELFTMFDRLLLLKSGGHDVFFGHLGRKSAKLIHYFESASGFKERLPRGWKEVLPDGKTKMHLKINPANWMFDVIGTAGHKGADQADYSVIWRESELYQQACIDIEFAGTAKPGSKPLVLSAEYQSSTQRFLDVQRRIFQSHWRNAPMNLTRAALMLTLGTLFGVIFIQLSTDDIAGVNSMMGAAFVGVTYPSSVMASSPVSALFRSRAVYYRETTIGLYGYKIFNATIFLVELPFVFCTLALFIIPYYFMIGWTYTFVHFARFFLMCLLTVLTYASVTSLLLALLPDQAALNVLNSLCNSFWFMFAGLFLKPIYMPRAWKWMHYVDPAPKSLNSVLMMQFYCDTSAPDAATKCPMITPTPGEPAVYTYDYLANLLEASADDYGQMVGWLILTMAVLRILNLLALKYVSHIKRHVY